MPPHYWFGTCLICAFQESKYVCDHWVLGVSIFIYTFCILGTNSDGNNYRAYSDGGYTYSNKGSSGNTTSTYYVSTYSKVPFISTGTITHKDRIF